MNSQEKVCLTSIQVWSLQQYADACKMRPQTYGTDWRDVPTSDDEFNRLSPEEKKMWLGVADDF